MAEFAYTLVPGKIKELLAKIRQIGVPSKATVAWLKTIGFRSSNDSSMLGVLKFIELIDGSGTPTQRWTQYRGSSYKSILGDAIKAGYKDLYAIYSDAHNQGKDELSHVFSTSSSAGQQVISKTVATFKALCDEAKFEGNSAGVKTMESGPLHTPVATPQSPPTPIRQSGQPSVHIDIQVHISPESTSEQIDTIFKSMAKHLYGAKT